MEEEKQKVSWTGWLFKVGKFLFYTVPTVAMLWLSVFRLDIASVSSIVRSFQLQQYWFVIIVVFLIYIFTMVVGWRRIVVHSDSKIKGGFFYFWLSIICPFLVLLGSQLASPIGKSTITKELKNGQRIVKTNEKDIKNMSEEEFRSKLVGHYRAKRGILENDSRYVEASMLVGGHIYYELTISENSDFVKVKISGPKGTLRKIEAKYKYASANRFILTELEKDRLVASCEWFVGGSWQGELLNNKLVLKQVDNDDNEYVVTLEKI